MLLIIFVTSLAYYAGDGHPQAHRVTKACERCALNLNSTVGEKWHGCVVEQLLGEQAEARSADMDEYFPILPHVLDPLAPEPGAHGAGHDTSELLKNLLRNYSCDFEDGGSQPLRSMTWEYQPADPCAAAGEEATVPYSYKKGFLPEGNTLKALWVGKKWLPQHSVPEPQRMTVSQAQEACLLHKACAGFTFHSTSLDDEKAVYAIHFKTSAATPSADNSWHTYKRLRNDCRAGFRRPPLPLERFQVDVLREEPPVYIVREFVTTDECEHMTSMTIPNMERSVVFGGSSGQQSAYRQSYSVNMYPDYDDESNIVTRVVRRKFAFAREVAEYEELIEGEGQEPLNSVYYKDWDDQYRPHCDGECHGGAYRKGTRIATSLTYCKVAQKGGYTLFTRSGLKVVPRERDMLFFGYKLRPTVEGGAFRMDPGYTEHSGCPLRKGTKWIATMWYREGMTAENDWTKNR